MRRFGASQRQACAVLRLSMSVYLYRSRARDAAPLMMRIKEITGVRVHYGYRRVHVLLRREGWKDNHKRVYRLYRAEGLSLRHKRPRRNKAARLRQPKRLVNAMNEIWSMDFVSDALFDGRRLRALTVLENNSCECLAIDVGQSLKGEGVVRTLERIKVERGLPRTIKVDNGPSSYPKRWTGGPTRTVSSWTSHGQGGRSTTPRSNPSTAGCARSV
jgi:putative transposase